MPENVLFGVSITANFDHSTKSILVEDEELYLKFCDRAEILSLK
jgi:hypothetical protein